MEVWKDIDADYEISNYGNVRSKARICIQPYKNGCRIRNLKEKTLTQQCSNDGYLRVKLHGVYVSVSHLVATAFVDNPNSYTVVHHKDHNTHNNHCENLEWIDVCEHNQNHSSEKTKKVYQYTTDGTLVAIYNSQAECAKLGFQQPKICLCCQGKRNYHKGFIWSYEPLV